MCLSFLLNALPEQLGVFLILGSINFIVLCGSEENELRGDLKGQSQVSWVGWLCLLKRFLRKMSNLVLVFSALGLLYSESLYDRLCLVFDPYLIMGDKFQTATANWFKNASLGNG